MNFLKINKLKGKASFQDLGRISSQHLGFSASGAADEYSYLLANQLINNEQSATAIEVTLGQVSLIASSHCNVVITGADCQSFIIKQNGERLSVINNQIFTLYEEDELNLSIPKQQLHSYIAIEGGFSAKNWLGSASQTANEYALSFGEKEISEDSKLHFIGSSQSSSLEPVAQKKHSFHQPEKLYLRFLPSPLWKSWSKENQHKWLKQDYKISSQSNRMGYRLSGEPILHKNKRSTLSKPITYGTIQLPPDGQPIILMKERQTIGGYPVLGSVIQTDLFRLSQKRPGEYVNFIPVTLEQAQSQLLAFRNKFHFL